MARHGRRKKFRKYIRGSVDEKLSLGTLGATSLISDIFDDTVTEKAWISSVNAAWSMQGWTQGLDDGPIMVGLAHSDYTDAEIEAVIENTGSWDEGDLVQQEISRRKVRVVGIFPTPHPDSANVAVVLNDGKKILTKCGWMLQSGKSLRVWGYNMGASALATTDPDVNVQGFANLWPA